MDIILCAVCIAPAIDVLIIGFSGVPLPIELPLSKQVLDFATVCCVCCTKCVFCTEFGGCVGGGGVRGLSRLHMLSNIMCVLIGNHHDNVPKI